MVVRCSAVSRVSRVRVRHQCVQGLKCPRTEVTIHQFGPIYRTQVIAKEIQWMYANYAVWGGGSGETKDDFFHVEVEIHQCEGTNFAGEEGIKQRNVA